MSVKRKPFSVPLNDGEKELVSIAAKLDNKFAPQYCRDVTLDAAKKLVGEYEKNSAGKEKKAALERARSDLEKEAKERAEKAAKKSQTSSA